jgi:hypothetical protein
VVIDLPAVLSPALAAAFLAADAIVIPTSYSPIDVEATRRTLRHADVATTERAGAPPAVLAVPMLIRRDWLGRTRTPGRPTRLQAPTAPPIGFHPEFAEAYGQSDWIGGYAPRSRAHRELEAVVNAIEAGLKRAGTPAAAAGRPTGPADGGGARTPAPPPPDTSGRRLRMTAGAL